MVALIQRSKWEEARLQFEAGNYKTLKELSERLEIDYQALRDKIYRDKWSLQVSTRNNKVLQVVQEVKETEAQKWVKETVARSYRYRKDIDATRSQCASTPDGSALLEPSDLKDLVSVESTLDTMARRSLGLSDKLDITSNNQSLGESFVSAIAKMRGSNLPRLTDADLKDVMSAEIVD